MRLEIKGYKNKYAVDVSGVVYSLNYNNTGSVVPLKQRVNKKGRLYVNLCLNGKYKTFMVHRLVAETFLSESYQDGLEVNHKDGNKLNNSVDNLEWCSRAYNTEHAVSNNLYPTEFKNKSCKISNKDIISIRTELMHIYTTAELSAMFNCSRHHMNNIIKLKCRIKI